MSYLIIFLAGVALFFLLLLICLFAARQPVPRWNLRQSTVFLTGGSAGIGLELAKQLTRRHVRYLVIAARREPVLQRAVAEIDAVARTHHSPTRVSYVVLDVSSSLAEVQRAMQHARQHQCDGNAFDLLICNAGFAHPARFVDCTPEVAEAMLRTNLFGALYPLWSALPSMLHARRGRVVLMSSLAARAPIAGYALYAASKAGLRALALSVDMENSCLGVRVQVVSPPDVATPGYDAENRIKSPECVAISRWGAGSGCATAGSATSTHVPNRGGNNSSRDTHTEGAANRDNITSSSGSSSGAANGTNTDDINRDSGNHAISASTMARAIVNGVENYRFDVTCGFDGAVVRLASGALEPASSVWTLGLECMLAGVLRLGLAMFSRICYGIVRRVRRCEEKEEQETQNGLPEGEARVGADRKQR